MTKYAFVMPKKSPYENAPPASGTENDEASNLTETLPHDDDSLDDEVVLYDEPEHTLTDDMRTWPPAGPNIELSSFWVSKVVGADFISSATRNKRWPRVFHSKKPLKKGWVNKGRAAKRMGPNGRWVYLVVFGYYTMAGYEGKDLPLNPSGKPGHTRHTITEGRVCVVQSSESAPDPRYARWCRGDKPPTVPKNEPTTPLEAQQKHRKVVPSFNGPQPVVPASNNTVPNTRKRKQAQAYDEDGVEEPTVAPKPATVKKRSKPNAPRPPPTPSKGTKAKQTPKAPPTRDDYAGSECIAADASFFKLEDYEQEPAVVPQPITTHKRVGPPSNGTFPMTPKNNGYIPNVLPVTPRATYPPLPIPQGGNALLPTPFGATPSEGTSSNPPDAAWQEKYVGFLEGRLKAADREKEWYIQKNGNLEAHCQMLLARITNLEKGE